MEKMEQAFQQDDAEQRIQPLSTEEINAVSGGAGSRRSQTPETSATKLSGSGIAAPKNIFTAR